MKSLEDLSRKVLERDPIATGLAEIMGEPSVHAQYFQKKLSQPPEISALAYSWNNKALSALYHPARASYVNTTFFSFFSQEKKVQNFSSLLSLHKCPEEIGDLHLKLHFTFNSSKGYELAMILGDVNVLVDREKIAYTEIVHHTQSKTLRESLKKFHEIKQIGERVSPRYFLSEMKKIFDYFSLAEKARVRTR